MEISELQRKNEAMHKQLERGQEQEQGSEVDVDLQAQVEELEKGREALRDENAQLKQRNVAIERQLEQEQVAHAMLKQTRVEVGGDDEDEKAPLVQKASSPPAQKRRDSRLEMHMMKAKDALHSDKSPAPSCVCFGQQCW